GALASEWPLAFYRDAVARAGVRPVIPHRAVLGAAIVPERYGVLCPAKAALEERILRVLIQIGEHGVALIAWNANDVVREAAVHVERLLSRHRVRAYDGMLGVRIGWFVGDAGVCVKTAIDRLSIVDRGEPMKVSLHTIRQRIVSGIHAGE